MADFLSLAKGFKAGKQDAGLKIFIWSANRSKTLQLAPEMLRFKDRKNDKPITYLLT